MISTEDKLFLQKHFGINCDKISKDILNKILDNLICDLDDAILEKEKNNLDLLKDIVLSTQSLNNKD